MNKNIVITSDSGCDLCDLPKLNIPINMIYSYVIDENNVQYRDRLDINNEQICKEIMSGKIFRTSAPNISDFTQFFRTNLEKYEYIVHLSISSEISSSAYNNSQIAANEINKELKCKRIYIIDSKNASSGSMIAAFYLAKLLEYESVEDSIKILNQDYIPNIINKFIVPDPTGFIRSGRNKADLTIKETWNIRKIKLVMKLGFKFEIIIKNGKFTQSKLIKSSLKNIEQKFLLNQLDNDRDLIDDKLLIIGETFSDNNLFNAICQDMGKKYGFKSIKTHFIGNTLTAYGCKNILNISYLRNINVLPTYYKNDKI